MSPTRAPRQKGLAGRVRWTNVARLAALLAAGLLIALGPRGAEPDPPRMRTISPEQDPRPAPLPEQTLRPDPPPRAKREPRERATGKDRGTPGRKGTPQPRPQEPQPRRRPASPQQPQPRRPPAPAPAATERLEPREPPAAPMPGEFAPSPEP